MDAKEKIEQVLESQKFKLGIAHDRTKRELRREFISNLQYILGERDKAESYVDIADRIVKAREYDKMKNDTEALKALQLTNKSKFDSLLDAWNNTDLELEDKP